MTSSTILVVGDLMIDVVVAMRGELVRGSDMPSEISTTFGGTAANVATWLSVCGSRVRILGTVGSDPWGEQMLSHLEKFGIECHITSISSLPTGALVALCHPDGERSFLPDARANSAMHTIDANDETWQSVNYLYVSGYTLLNAANREWAKALMREAHNRGVTVVLDPASSAPLEQVDPAEIAEWLSLTDVLIPNEQEHGSLLRLLGGQIAVPRLAIKQGSDGVRLHSDHSWTSVPAAPATVIDTIGAGDAFAAGLLHSLNLGHDFEDSASFAVRVAAAAVGIRGAQPEPSSTLDIH